MYVAQDPSIRRNFRYTSRSNVLSHLPPQQNLLTEHLLHYRSFLQTIARLRHLCRSDYPLHHHSHLCRRRSLLAYRLLHRLCQIGPLPQIFTFQISARYLVNPLPTLLLLIQLPRLQQMPLSLRNLTISPLQRSLLRHHQSRLRV